jgi:hypothetical protein
MERGLAVLDCLYRQSAVERRKLAVVRCSKPNK